MMAKQSPKNSQPETAMRSFDESLPMALLRAREATMLRFRPILADHGLTEQQWRVLRALTNIDGAAADRSIDVGDVAEATFLLGPSLSRILSNLDGRKLISRTTDPDDQRRSIIKLTAKGRRLVEKIAPASEAEYAEIERLLGTGKLHSLLALLGDLSETRPVQAEPTSDRSSTDDQDLAS